MQSSAEPEPVRQAGFQRVERSDARTWRLVAVAAAALVLAVAKPWSIGQHAGAGFAPDARSAVAVAARSSETPLPSGDHATVDSGTAGRIAGQMAGIAAPDAEHVGCLRSDDWLIVTLERDGTNVIRTWTVVQPVPSLVGLPIPAPPSLRIVATNLVGIGLCAPALSDATPAVPLMAAWKATTPNTSPSPLPAIPRVGAPEPGMALLYGHPRDAVGEDATWPSGRFLLEALDPRLNPNRVVWVAVDIVSGGNHRG